MRTFLIILVVAAMSLAIPWTGVVPVAYDVTASACPDGDTDETSEEGADPVQRQNPMPEEDEVHGMPPSLPGMKEIPWGSGKLDGAFSLRAPPVKEVLVPPPQRARV